MLKFTNVLPSILVLKFGILWYFKFFFQSHILPSISFVIVVTPSDHMFSVEYYFIYFLRFVFLVHDYLLATTGENTDTNTEPDNTK